MTRVLHYILVLFSLSILSSSSCPTYIHNGIACDSCPPGSHRVAHCTTDQTTRCTPCGYSHYMHICNTNLWCLECSDSCDITHQEIVKNCTKTTDAVCRCKEGFYLKHPSHPSCKSHSPCPPGSGVVSPGTPSTNTICEKCKEGSFSNVYSKTEKCLNHTKCTLYLSRGNLTHDAVCSSNTAHPSLGAVQPTTTASSIKHKNNTKEWTTVSSNDTTENTTAETNSHISLTTGTIVAIIVVPLVMIVATFCFSLLGCYDWIKNVVCGKKDDDHSNGGEKQSLNQDQELPEICTTSGDGDEPGPSGTDRSKTLELKRSTSRTSDSEEEPLMEKNNDTAAAKSSSSGKRRSVVSELGITDQERLEQAACRSRLSSSNDAYVHSTDQLLDGEPSNTDTAATKSSSNENSVVLDLRTADQDLRITDQKLLKQALVTAASKSSSCKGGRSVAPDHETTEQEPLEQEMSLREFFYKVASILHPHNWKEVMRKLPGKELTDANISNIEHDFYLQGINEVKYECLKRWWKKNTDLDVVSSVVRALEKSGWTTNVQEIKKVRVNLTDV